MARWGKAVDFGDNVFLNKYLSDFDEEHPLLVNFESNSEYVRIVEDLLKKLDKTPNLDIKIVELKDASNWESTFSELEFARKVKALNPEFIKTLKGSRSPDLKVSLLGKDIFFEVKLLLENDAITRVNREICKIKSDLIVVIDYGSCETFDNKKADRLIEYIRNKICAQEIGSYPFIETGTEIEITRKKSTKTERTDVMSLCLFEIPMDYIRKKVFDDFDSKLQQFESCSPIFWVIDSQRWKTSNECFASIASSLFLKQEAKCLNGIIAIAHRNTNLFINNFAKQQPSNEIIGKLKALFSR
jgi:hypothetical protein